MKIEETLLSLCQAPGMTGEEMLAADRARELLEPFCPDAHIDRLGNVVGCRDSVKTDAPPLPVITEENEDAPSEISVNGRTWRNVEDEDAPLPSPLAQPFPLPEDEDPPMEDFIPPESEEPSKENEIPPLEREEPSKESELLPPESDFIQPEGEAAPSQEKRLKVLLDAHIDQVGMVVTGITEEGFVSVAAAGTLDRRLLPAQRVKIYTYDHQWVDGVITCLPPHLTSGKGKVPTWEEVYVDIGYSKKEAETMLAPGDSVFLYGRAGFLGNTESEYEEGALFTAPALDDRSGVLAILLALERLQGLTLPYDVEVLFSTQEELGERGAAGAAYAIEPDIAIVVDVSFAGNGERSATGVMGKGPMIGFSPTLDKSLSKALVAAAKAHHIPYQREVLPGTTGTNADRMALSRGGIRTATVSIPLRYMHTPEEVVAISDIESTADLLAAFLAD